MKQGHLLLMFLTVYMFCFMALYVEQGKYDMVQAEKYRVEQALLEAVEVAGKEFEKVINASEEIRKETFEAVFLESLYVSMGFFETAEEQGYLRMYLPMLILAEEDGVFFFSMQEVEKDSVTELRHVWSEKVPYIFSEDDVDGVRTYDVLETLEKNASDIVTKHNYIASQYGIFYQFHAPSFLRDTSEKIEFPMLLAVFQGWPLNASKDILYENCIDAAVYLRKKELYMITWPENILNAVCVYHKRSCPLVVSGKLRICCESITLEEAIDRFGAYGCKKCIKE